MTGATAIQEQVATPWTKLSGIEAEIRAHDAARAKLQKECDALEDTLQSAQTKADAVGPGKWSPDRAKYFETLTHVEAKRDEISQHGEGRAELVARREEAKAEIAAAEQQIGKCEREYGIARHECERAENALRIAAQKRRGVADAEADVAEKREKLAEKTEALRLAWGVRGFPTIEEIGTKLHSKLSREQRLMETNPEFREAELAVRRLEREHDKLRDEIGPLALEVERKNQNPFPVGSELNPVTDAVLEALYPEVSRSRVKFADAQMAMNTNLARDQKKLAELLERFAAVEAERVAQMAKREQLLAAE